MLEKIIQLLCRWGFSRARAWIMLSTGVFLILNTTIAKAIEVQSELFDASTKIYWVEVPAYWGKTPLELYPALVGKTLMPLSRWAAQQSAQPVVAAINGGYFDPQNQKTTSWLSYRGQLLANPTENEHLTTNLTLKPYLNKIFEHRSSLMWAHCDGGVSVNIIPHIEGDNLGAQLGVRRCGDVSELGGGPQLLPTLTLEQEGFVGKNRDPLRANQKLARSAVAILADEKIWLVLVQQTQLTGGMRLSQLAQWLKDHGATQAMALDGGSSSALWTPQTGTIIGALDKNGNRPHRAILSVLAVRVTRDY
ncbi:MAG: phosphodiester glycosidase family protein [Vampirovibrionales bacterium]|nr:phosphodiester glycosidase family protein [Vampirovibrionales bacterium]